MELKPIKRLHTEDEKSTFHYWFDHWRYVNLVAIKLGIWRPRYLLHDFEKPWLKLITPYKKVKKWHKNHNRHHLQYGLRNGFCEVDWEQLVCDWEASRYTKADQPLNARQTLEKELKKDRYSLFKAEIKYYLEPLLDKLGL